MIGAGMVAPHDAGRRRRGAPLRRSSASAPFLFPPGTVGRKQARPALRSALAECESSTSSSASTAAARTISSPTSLEVFDRLMMWHTFSQPLGIMRRLRITAGGVCERFPKLRFALLEGNCSWAPWLFYRLDEHYEWLGAFEAPDLKMKPSEYFLRNCFLSVEADEETASQYIERFGDDNLVFSTDYPHADSKFPKSVESFRGLPLPEASKKKILWDNWVKLYGVNGR
jgi:predicted TIM-barrel fold metal-dependent hydrolase